ncbi:hypothetical protein B9J78_01845 [bacterium Unc6]|nr:hypothetical protein [bacterium Unc6]
MKIKLSEIPASGLLKEEILAPEQIDLDRKDIKIQSPVIIRCDVIKNGGKVDIITDVNFSFEFVCARCLKTSMLKLQKQFLFTYSINQKEGADITKDVREELILDYPIRMLCTPDCRGLCPKCGKNLNEEKCQCVQDDRFHRSRIKSIEKLKKQVTR